MNGEILFEAFADIDEGFIDESFPSKTAKRIRMLKIGIAAALVALVLIPLNMFRENTSKGTTPYYDVYLDNGKYYLQFPDIPLSVGAFKNHHQIIHPTKPTTDIYNFLYTSIIAYPNSISFETVSELRDDFQNKKFTDDELQVLRRKAECAGGRIPIPNLSALYEPALPDDLKPIEVIWSGEEYYGFELNYFDPVYHYGSFTILSEASYQNIYDCRYDPTYVPKYATNTLVLTTAERNATIYLFTAKNGRESKSIHYKLTNPAGGELLINENYADPNDTIPYSIHILGQQDENYFTVTISNLSQRPSVEWLSEFGLTQVD